MLKEVLFKIKSHSSKILKIILILSIVGGLFYWYEYRPVRIKQYCMKETIERVKNANRATASTIRLLYWRCTIEKGL